MASGMAPACEAMERKWARSTASDLALRFSRWRHWWLAARGMTAGWTLSGGLTPGKPPSAELYAVVGGLIVWLLVDVLPHVHVSIGLHWREGENPAPELMLGDAPDVTTYREASASLQKAAVTGRDAHAVIKSLIAAGP